MHILNNNKSKIVHESNAHTAIDSDITVKMAIKNKMKSSRNITLMVIFQCVLYTFGKIFFRIHFLIYVYLKKKKIFRNDSLFDILYIVFYIRIDTRTKNLQ